MLKAKAAETKGLAKFAVQGLNHTMDVLENGQNGVQASALARAGAELMTYRIIQEEPRNMSQDGAGHAL